MKIAAVSEDGVTISQHFGRAPFYVVLTFKDDKIILREKTRQDGPRAVCGRTTWGPRRACYPWTRIRTGVTKTPCGMAEAIADCDVLLARGMGAGAYESLWHVGVRPLITDVADIDEAVNAYLAGTLTDHVEKLH